MKPRDLRLAGLVAVLVTALAAVVGGTAAGRVTEPSTLGTEAAPGNRAFVCTGGLPQARSISGVAGRSLREAELRELRRLEVPESSATGAFASQVARNGKALALSLCPEPRNEWWFVGAGASVRHSSVVTIDNPRDGAAVVNLTVFGPGGEVAAPGLTGFTVAGGKTRVLNLAEVAPAVGDLVVHVQATRGLVSVGVADTFALGNGTGAQVREWVPDQFRPRREVLLTGVPRQPGNTALLLANPSAVENRVQVEVVGEKGPFVPKGLENIAVPPRTVVTVDARSAIDGQAAAVRLTGTGPIVATLRSTRAGDQSLASAAAPLQDGTVIALPDSDARDLTLTGLADGEVTVTSYGTKGRTLKAQQVAVTADTSTRIALPAKARYVLIAADSPVAVAGIVVGFKSGGTAALAVPPGARALRVPPVRPGW